MKPTAWGHGWGLFFLSIGIFFIAFCLNEMVIGGILGFFCYFYFGIKDTKGPRERGFFVGGSVVVWVGLFSLVPLDIYVLHWDWAMKLLLSVVSFWGFFGLKRMQRQIRLAERPNA